MTLIVLSGACLYTEAADGVHKAVRGLVERLVPERADCFVFETIEQDGGSDVFEIEARNGKVTIRGNNGVARAAGVNWYLNHYCGAQVSWCGSHLKLPDPLPDVQPKVRKTSWAKYRYFLNYCCFGYTLSWWNWEQWEKLIDWMALHGINAPLSVTGQEAVWEAACRRLGMKENEIKEFFAGPPYLPFQWMGCLDSWGGPLAESWIDRHRELQQKILKRQRAFGMTPVLQGFTGHVPQALAQRFPDAEVHKIRWIEWETRLLDPMDPLFQKVGRVFMEEQERLFGTDHLYAADTFIEMTPPRSDTEYLASLGGAIYRAMAQVDPEAVWVLQGWIFVNNPRFWKPPQARALFDAVPRDRMLLLDLHCEHNPAWTKTEAFYGKPWLWCNIQNFGGTVQLSGSFPEIKKLIALRGEDKAGRLCGLGFVNEALGYNPVIYDLLFESAWRTEPVNLDSWVRGYVFSRYGTVTGDALSAWKLLKDTVYQRANYGRSIVTRLPGFSNATAAVYDNYRLLRAWKYLLDTADVLGGRDSFRFDLVNVARQVLVNYAGVVQGRFAAAFRAKDNEKYKEAKREFLALLQDLDRLLATRREFLLGRWIADARRWGETDAERAKCEWNARRFLTLWGEGRAIDDYACREWSGLLSGYYHVRWKRFLDAAGAALAEDRAFDDSSFHRELRAWMKNWSSGGESFSATQEGDSCALARSLYKKYHKCMKPEAVSMTTGKPATCSHALAPYPAYLANDGRKENTNRFWATDVTVKKDAWWQVDLEEICEVDRVVVVPFYGDERYYGFFVDTSRDGKTWTRAADRHDNTAPARPEGYTCTFEKRRVRYIRVTFTGNSKNTGRHLVEVMAFGPGWN